MNKIIVSLGSKKGKNGDNPFGISFVALSRVRRLEDMLIRGEYFDLDRLQSIKLPHDLKLFDQKTNKLAEATKRNLGL